MNIMTIDPGYRKIGIYFSDKGVGHGYTIDTTGMNEEQALMTIHDTMRMLTKRHLPDVVVMEDYGYKGTPNSLTRVAEVKGIIKQIIYRLLGIKIIAMPIQTWKKYIIPSVVAKKKNKREYLDKIFALYAYNAKTKDEADAYLMCLAIGYITAGILKTESAKKIYEQLKETKGVKNEKR